jgi:hypothetical protein
MIIIKKVNFRAFFAVLFLALFLSGCAGTVKNMRTVSSERVDSAPDQGKSMVVFMRPSTFGFGIQSSVFEIIDDQPSLVGIVAAKAKVSYELEPGQHLFMAVGESADFLYADLEANKTYYALVTPRMGAWKARFSLKPIHAGELGSSQFNEWIEACEWVEKSSDSDAWASENMASIQEKHAKYYAKWMEKDLSERPKLLPQDGK